MEEADVALVAMTIGGSSVEISVDAPYAGDPPPEVPHGRCPGLWNFEVVELFVCGDDQHYLEVECGPHGHFLALRLHRPRSLVRDDLPVIRYDARIDGGRWRGTLALDARWIPSGLRTANAYRISGQGAERTYAAAFPGEGTPDFHRLDLFRPLDEMTGTDT